jgi:LPXTG-motif cell wall-anchored protein
VNLKSPFRRTTALVAGAFIGLIGAVALTSPASAHAPVVKGTASCLENGKWKVDWSVSNDYGLWADIRSVSGSTNPAIKTEGDKADRQNWSQTSAGGIKVDQNNPVQVAPNYANPVLGSKTYDATDTVAGLLVGLKWTDNWANSAKFVVDKPGTCGPAVPPSSPSPSNSASPSPSASVSTSPSASASASPSESASATPSESTPESPAPSESAPSPEPTPNYGEAEPIFDVTCDSMTIGLDNPEDGVEIPLVLQPSEGDKVVLDVKPGEKESHTFKASEGFKVKIYLKGYESESETVAWQAPDGCSTGGAGGGDDGGSLPLTGAAAGSIAAGAGVLLAAGLTLFFVARRRKVKFTA